MVADIIFIALAYLMGSLSSAIILCRLAGLPDPRQQGSGNPGATNVLRFGGKKLAVLVLVGDMLKGLLPVLVVQWLALPPATVAAVGAAAFLGHLFPIFFGFRGGKGVATSLGVLLGFSWLLGLSIVAIWLVMATLFRISSLAAITAALLAPLVCWQLLGEPSYTLAVSFMSVALLLRHHGNIRKLLRGEEPRIGSK